MNQESIIYITNIVIGVILATLATHYWREQRQSGQSGPMQYWAMAAWVLTIADCWFAARPILPFAIGRTVPNLFVTMGHVILYSGARRTAGDALRWRLSVAIVVAHVLGLIAFLSMPSLADFRMVLNGVVWGAFSAASAIGLRRGSPYLWKSIFAPASAFWAHAIFHGLRVSLALVFASNAWHQALGVLQTVGDLEVSFFMIALFVGLLIAHLQIRHEELMHTRAELKTLSGLLPICAWCKQIRDDDGYWKKVEEYFTARSGVKFTHGVCVDCVVKLSQQQIIPSE